MKNLIKRFWIYRIGWLLLTAALCCLGASAYYFEETDHEFIIAAFLQGAAVFLALSLAYFFFESRTHQRQRRLDEVVKRAIGDLRAQAEAAVIVATGVVWDQPSGHDNFGPNSKPGVFAESRKLIVERSHQIRDYETNILDRGGLFMASRRFEDLAFECEKLLRIHGSEISQHGILVRSLLTLEENVATEQLVWDAYPESSKGTSIGLPSDAAFNIVTLAAVALRLIDVIESENYIGDPEYESIRHFRPETFHRSRDWGLWR
ncbi:MAG: hypothetical protein IIA92_03050 [Chloroflexi bacterium]|nr:hypothetical protein [Chloroflexota bacterium]